MVNRYGAILTRLDNRSRVAPTDQNLAIGYQAETMLELWRRTDHDTDGRYRLSARQVRQPQFCLLYGRCGLRWVHLQPGHHADCLPPQQNSPDRLGSAASWARWQALAVTVHVIASWLLIRDGRIPHTVEVESAPISLDFDVPRAVDAPRERLSTAQILAINGVVEVGEIVDAALMVELEYEKLIGGWLLPHVAGLPLERLNPAAPRSSLRR